jgi:Ca2+-transporting ATPase
MRSCFFSQVLAAKAGLSKAGLCSTGYSFVAEFPFDSTIKRMSVAYQKGTHITLMAKGAIESIYSACDSISVNGALVPLQGSTAYSLPMLQKQVDKLAGQGLRVLALACKNVVGAWDRKAEREEVEVGLTFLGLVGMYDPPRPETRGAVEACLSAGITVR